MLIRGIVPYQKLLCTDIPKICPMSAGKKKSEAYAQGTGTKKHPIWLHV
jgi:hypothetical protein